MTLQVNQLRALLPEQAVRFEIQSFVYPTAGLRPRVTTSAGRRGAQRLTVSDLDPHLAADALWRFIDLFPVREHWIENGDLVLELEVR